MNSKDLLLLTVQISLIVQLLTGLVSAGGIFVKLDDKYFFINSYKN